ncbi:MAG: hypothetical protein LBC99_06505 [Spirochaetota bacterium]|nr:hypothetical protein [Spirochaetota bacterium]
MNGTKTDKLREALISTNKRIAKYQKSGDAKKLKNIPALLETRTSLEHDLTKLQNYAKTLDEFTQKYLVLTNDADDCVRLVDIYMKFISLYPDSISYHAFSGLFFDSFGASFLPFDKDIGGKKARVLVGCKLIRTPK